MAAAQQRAVFPVSPQSEYEPTWFRREAVDVHVRRPSATDAKATVCWRDYLSRDVNRPLPGNRREQPDSEAVEKRIHRLPFRVPPCQPGGQGQTLSGSLRLAHCRRCRGWVQRWKRLPHHRVNEADGLRRPKRANASGDGEAKLTFRRSGPCQPILNPATAHLMRRKPRKLPPQPFFVH